MHRNHRRRRGTYGIYYTPPAVTGHIVRSTHEILCAEFGLPDGLADTGAASGAASVSLLDLIERSDVIYDAVLVRRFLTHK